MHRGYIKLWRKSINSIAWQNQDIWRFWTYCLMKATHKETIALIGHKKVDLLPGQFIFGRKVASIETGLSERKIRTCKNFLENDQQITCKTTNKYSIITIVNWDTYNGCKTETTNKRPAKRPRDDQETTTYKNNKNNNYQEKAQDVLKVINEISGKKFKSTKDIVSLLKYKNGKFKSDELIELAQAQWKDEFIRENHYYPESLFRVTKFEGKLDKIRNLTAEKKKVYTKL